MRKKEVNEARKILRMGVEGYKRSWRTRKKWIDCVKENMIRKGYNSRMTSDRLEWKNKKLLRQ